MRWLYKIWGGFDGFRPSTIGARLLTGGELILGWAKYADVAEPGDEVWVWFHQGQLFTPGVYVKGIVESIDPVAQRLVLQTQEWSGTTPLTDENENAQLAPIVAPRYRQVFVLPEDFRRFEGCTANAPGALTCVARHCDYCTFWKKLPPIKQSQLHTPWLLSAEVAAFAPAYWVVANRSFVWNESGRMRPGIRRTTDMFYRFKTGEAALAYPLARGMVHALAKRGWIEAGAIVPVPLSPEKAKAKEIHRTLLLAQEVSSLIGVPVVDALKLRAPKGKRTSLNAGESMNDFRTDYERLLSVDAKALAGLENLILVDDVCTQGNTMAAVIAAIRERGVDADVIACTAGQMTVRAAVADDRAVFVA